MIKAVLFDLDGTLLDRDESVKKFIDDQYDRLHRIVGHILRETYIKRFIVLDKRGYVWKDKVYQRLVEEFQITAMTWEELLQDYLSEFKNHCVPFPNLISTLDKLKSRDIRLGMITNGRGQFQLDNIRALGIEKYFDTILISEWEGIKKPDPEIFKRALKQLKIAAHQSIFVGDHPENDVKAAQNVGMKGVWKKDPQWESAEADYIVDDLAELLLFFCREN
jgi:putative hydrolase of the HAD superfamily